MAEPDTPGPEFGSELRRRETPAHRRRRRNGIFASLLGIVAGAVTLVAAIRAMLIGEMVPGHSNSGSAATPALPGELVGLIGILMLGMCVWLLWRLINNKV